MTSQKALGQICSCFSDILYTPQEFIYDGAIGVLFHWLLFPSLSLSLPTSHIDTFFPFLLSLPLPFFLSLCWRGEVDR